MTATRYQFQCLQAIDKFTVDGVSPSFRELQYALKVKGIGVVHTWVTALIERGYLTSIPTKARSLQVTPKGSALLVGNTDLSALSNAALKQLARSVQAEIRKRTPRDIAA